MGRATWFFIVLAVGIALLGNYVSATWAKGQFFSIWFYAMLFISPLVFVTFGLVTSRISVAAGSGIIDSLLSISTIAMGLTLFGEWSALTWGQYFGVAAVITGLILIQHDRLSHFPRAHAKHLLKICFSVYRGGELRLSYKRPLR